ncbi:uncharacterized protein PG986_007398 [Apiospora aurea]|uniref:Uncharacterized protein n=1 Tax=Apiospora aurea TaxID=335848 RepID=A0ABR1QCG3_9PEZI
MRPRSRPNSFVEWMVGRNCLSETQRRRPPPPPEPRGPRKVATLHWSTDDESEEDTVSLTVPRARTPRRTRNVRFEDGLRPALKEPTDKFPEEPAEAPVQPPAESPEAETNATTESEHEVDPDCPCELCAASLESQKRKNATDIHAKHKAVKAERAKREAEEKAKRGTKSNKKNNQAHNDPETSVEPGPEASTSEAPSDSDDNRGKKKKGKQNQAPKKNKGKKNQNNSEETSEDAEASTTENETPTEGEPEAESEKEGNKAQNGKTKKQKNAKKDGGNGKDVQKGGKAQAKSNKRGDKQGAQAKDNAAEAPPEPAQDSTKDTAPRVPEEVFQKIRRSTKKRSKIPPHHPPPELRKPNLMLPIQSKVSHVEHVLETGADPEPNAFHDPQNGILRHYSGAAYGNPHSRLYPQRSYKESPPVGTPHPLNNPWYHGFQYDSHGNRLFQQDPGPRQPQYAQQGPMPMPPQQQPPTGMAPPHTSGPNQWFQGWGTAVVGGDKAGATPPQNDSPSVGAVQRKEKKKNVAFSARDASSGFGEPSAGSGRAAPSRDGGGGRKTAGAKDTNTLWANSSKSQGTGGRKTAGSVQKDADNNSVNFAGETVDSFLNRLKSNSSKHDSPQQPQGGNGGGGSVRNNSQNGNGYAGWNGQDNGFPAGPPAATGAGSNNGGWGGSNQWGGGQNNNNNNANMSGAPQGWNNNISPIPDNNNMNGGWPQDFNRGSNGQRNSAAGSNQQQQPGWGSIRSGSKKNESPMQFGNGSNQSNGPKMSPVPDTQPGQDWGGNDVSQGWGNNSNNNNQDWANGNGNNNNAGQDWGGGNSNQGVGQNQAWGTGSNDGGGGQNQDWGNTSNRGGPSTAWANGAGTGDFGGDANNDAGWGTGLDNDNNVIGGGNGSGRRSQNSHGSKGSKKSKNGSGGGSKRSWKQGDDNVGPASRQSGDIPGAWPSSNDQQQPSQRQSSSPNGGNVMDNNENGGDDFGDYGATNNNNNINSGGADWHDASAAQGTTYWEEEGRGTENVVQDWTGNNDTLKAGGSSWW